MSSSENNIGLYVFVANFRQSTHDSESEEVHQPDPVVAAVALPAAQVPVLLRHMECGASAWGWPYPSLPRPQPSTHCDAARATAAAPGPVSWPETVFKLASVSRASAY